MGPDLQAADGWVAKRDAGLNADERRQLRAWLAADPRNAIAFARADRGRTELDWPLHAGALDDVLAGLEIRARKRRSHRQVALSAAACAVAILGLCLAWPSLVPGAASARQSTLVVMEPQRHTLPDGSIVELKDGARVETHFTDRARFVTLVRGTAHFQVTPRSQPFIVNAAGVTARALGTAFSVTLETQEVSVLVTEGRVAVNKESETTTPTSAADAAPVEPLAILDAGRSVSVPTAINEPPSVPVVVMVPASEVEERLSWRVPRLEFSGTPLVEVLAMVNRHNRQQFVLADPALERLALSGVLRADKIDALIAMLESDFKLRATRTDGQIVLQKAP
jgi:transmembrane sensor